MKGAVAVVSDDDSTKVPGLLVSFPAGLHTISNLQCHRGILVRHAHSDFAHRSRSRHSDSMSSDMFACAAPLAALARVLENRGISGWRTTLVPPKNLKMNEKISYEPRRNFLQPQIVKKSLTNFFLQKQFNLFFIV
jgi:hypothetical protein